MHIYIANDNGGDGQGETTWIVKSKDIKRFRREFDWMPDYEIKQYPVNNLEDICFAVLGGAGKYSGRVYR
tara:strand:+ start:341 stop:550 length:210 start_codon:yes stop_codon:yes gene_type:complete